jgi:hypothetical protein
VTTPRTPEDVIKATLGKLGIEYATAEWTDQITRALTLAGFELVDTLRPARLFTRDQVETAWNAGAELVLQDDELGLSDSETDLVNLVCNAIGTCLDHPETDSLSRVILANYDPELDDEDEGLSDEDADAKRVAIVKGWI